MPASPPTSSSPEPSSASSSPSDAQDESSPTEPRVKKPVTIYTDGACSGNPGPGGWGALLISGQHRKEITGGEEHTTNNRMELLAAIEALEALKFPCTVNLYTDSSYVQQGIKSWINNWKRKGWRTSAGKPVKNRDLWMRLDVARERHEVTWRWVKGHSGDPGNERADELARKGMSGYL